MNLKTFYENHLNFSLRTVLEYFISPGIKCKYDILRREIELKREFPKVLDLGCSGDSFLLFFDNKKVNFLLDLAEEPLKYYSNEFVYDKNVFIPKKDCGINLLINGDICSLPYRDNTFDLICILDVLEHIYKDKIAIQEICRILKYGGYLAITLPRGKSFFNPQDQLIGHYRRYDKDEIINLFEGTNLRLKKVFGVYGSLFRITRIQANYPKEVETNIIKLRKLYRMNLLFRIIWNFIVRMMAFIMKVDAKYSKYEKLYNIGMILKKV